jgi:hypothetical protein
MAGVLRGCARLGALGGAGTWSMNWLKELHTGARRAHTGILAQHLALEPRARFFTSTFRMTIPTRHVCRPAGAGISYHAVYPRLTSWTKVCRPSGAWGCTYMSTHGLRHGLRSDAPPGLQSHRAQEQTRRGMLFASGGVDIDERWRNTAIGDCGYRVGTESSRPKCRGLVRASSLDMPGGRLEACTTTSAAMIYALAFLIVSDAYSGMGPTRGVT